ncbi:MAG: hypothetical protein ACLRFN_03000, partial [Alphaproteobacteria bacterium]
MKQKKLCFLLAFNFFYATIITIKKGFKMKCVVFSAENCPKCEMLKTTCPDVECIEITADNQIPVLNFCRMANIKSLPFVVMTGELNELEKTIKGE